MALAFGIEQGIQRQHRCLAAQPQGHPVRPVVQTEICLQGLSQLRPVHRFVEVLDRADGVAVLEAFLAAGDEEDAGLFILCPRISGQFHSRPASIRISIYKKFKPLPAVRRGGQLPGAGQGRDGVLRLKPGENLAAQVADLLLGITLILTGRHSVYISRPLAASWLHYRWGIPVCRGRLFDGLFLVYAVQFLSFRCLYLCSVHSNTKFYIYILQVLTNIKNLHKK